MSEPGATNLLVLGDLHGSLDETDVRWLDGRGAHAILVVGDIGRLRWRSALPVAAVLATLRTPTWMMTGNHDAASLPQVAAEAIGPAVVAKQLHVGMEERLAALDAALGAVRRVGYLRAELPGGVHLVAARPHTMGGPQLSFVRAVEAAHGVRTLEASAERLIALVDEVPPEAPVVFLAHNGPSGLGAQRDDIFGRDFHPDQGDWGDPDLAAAVSHAERSGRTVAVVAGHMHHALRGGGVRRTAVRRGRTLIVNAARVPRIERSGVRHHVELTIGAEGALAWSVQIDPAGQVERTPLLG
jgi:uncharacterized protein (TIGR04168 family)